MSDVIKGPGEYRMRDGSVATILAIVRGKAIGYRISVGNAYAADWLAVSGCYIEGETSDSDILPPEPVITGPGPYESRRCGTFHCAFVDASGVAHGYYENSMGIDADSVHAINGRVGDRFESDRDVIRKRVTP